MHARLVAATAVAALVMTSPPAASAQAQDPQVALRQEIERLRSDLDRLRQQYEARLAALEARLALPAPPQAPAAAPAAVEPPASPGPSAAPAGNAKVFNPDMSVLGNFVGAAGRNPVSDQPALQLTEVEMAFQAVVDPYARGDFFLSASPDGVEVEEGYVTFMSLPAGLLLKAGKMRAQFGKVNTMHTHVLPWADRPLVSQNLLGGEEGLVDSGVSLSRLIPNGFLFLEATGEVYRGASEVFESDRRSRLNYVGRLRGYRDLTEGTNIDLGASYANGPGAGLPDFTRQLFGIDATFRYRPLRRAIYRQFIGRTEMMWSRQDTADSGDQQAFGLFGSADYQFARRWYVGARGDYAGRALDASLHDRGGSASLTFRPSEFSLVRGQYRRTRYADAGTADEFLLQLNFAIGAHGAHPF